MWSSRASCKPVARVPLGEGDVSISSLCSVSGACASVSSWEGRPARHGASDPRAPLLTQ